MARTIVSKNEGVKAGIDYGRLSTGSTSARPELATSPIRYPCSDCSMRTVASGIGNCCEFQVRIISFRTFICCSTLARTDGLTANSSSDGARFRP